MKIFNLWNSLKILKLTFSINTKDTLSERQTKDFRDRRVTIVQNFINSKF